MTRKRTPIFTHRWVVDGKLEEFDVWHPHANRDGSELTVIVRRRRFCSGVEVARESKHVAFRVQELCFRNWPHGWSDRVRDSLAAALSVFDESDALARRSA